MSESTNDRLSDIVGIRLRGGLFNVPTDLTFFPSPQENQKNKNKSQNPPKNVIIYGRNGAGKSTIARAIKSIAGEWQPTIQEAQFVDKNHQPIILNEDERKRIFVFDEEFIDKNIRLRERDLDTIVMLGQSVDLEEQISAEEAHLKELQSKFEDQKKEVNQYNDLNDTKSPLYWSKLIKHSLQGDLNWAGRDKEIQNHKKNTSVNDNTFERFLNIHPSASRDELNSEFTEKIQQLRELRRYADNQIITTAVPFCHFENYNETHIRELLAQKIERPNISDRDKKLIELSFEKLDMRYKTFSDPNLTECPYCFQPISQDYKCKLIQSIKNALNQIDNQHRDDLQKCKQTPPELNLYHYSSLPSFRECQDLLEALKESIQDNNKKLEQKCHDPYTPIIEDIAPVNERCTQLNAALKKLEQERIQFNDKNSAIQKLQKTLVKLNDEITYYEIHEFIIHYTKQCEQQKTVNNNYKDTEMKIKSHNRQLNTLKAQLNNVTVALDLINGYLKYIFFSNDRFKITVQGNSYVLLSNGQSVTPPQISTGERNIIALCYFFAHIMQNQDPAKACKNDYLLVIDDPVSSFDLNNRVGITSFLAFQLRQFLNSKSSTRAVIMTHSLQVYYDMKQIVDDIWGNNVAKKAGYELVNQQLQLISDDQKRHEYAKLISIIFNYANGAPDTLDSYDLSIGNMMRQVLEAFSTFQYQKGITKIISDPDIAAILDKKNVGPYFENLMYRLILHGESHTEKKVKTMQNMEFLPSYSQEEKQKIAKSVLCLIYLLAPKHLLAHLQSEQEKEEKKQQKQEQAPCFKETLEKWFQEIREENPSMT